MFIGKVLKFTACFDSGVVSVFEAVSYKSGNRWFKFKASYEGHGVLYINGKKIRESGQGIK